MKTKSEHKTLVNPHSRCNRASERGNALVYVLIAIVLFGALSFTLGRQTDTNEAGMMSDEMSELYATQIISYTAQVRSAIEQMEFTAATSVDQLDFTAPTDAAFDTGTLIHKVYHPQGGGVVPGKLPAAAIAQTATDPVAGWYFGRFNNIEWTATTGEDVILTAFQIDPVVCGKINEKINGSSAIPTTTVALRNILIDDALAAHTGTNVPFTTILPASICPDCQNMGSLCIQNGGQYAFYTIIADQ